MYSYDEDNKKYYFKGDLKQYLLDKGVAITHINKMKEKILEPDRDAYYDFSKIGSSQRDYIDLVPLEKVIGTSRCTAGLSVFENVRTMYDGERAPHRFTNCFSFLEKLSLSELRKSYEELYDPVKMVYYVDDDKYYLSSNGNHRTLTAMIIGAEYIRAKVTDANCNTLKKEKYIFSQKFLDRYKIVKIMCSGNIYDIMFKDEIGVYEVCGYSGPSNDEDLFSFLERLSNTIDEDRRKAAHINKMPMLIKKIVLKRINSYRIYQLLYKKYMTEDEVVFWRCRRPITLYTL